MHVGNGQKLSFYVSCPRRDLWRDSGTVREPESRQQEVLEQFWESLSRIFTYVSWELYPRFLSFKPWWMSRNNFKLCPQDPAPSIFCLTSERQRFSSQTWFAAKLSQPALLVQDLILDLIVELSKSLQMLFIWEEDRVGMGAEGRRGFLQGKGLVFSKLVVWLGAVAWF